MKKILSVLFLLSMSMGSGVCQNFNVQAAANWLKDKNTVKAKKCIDLAAANEATANDSKMWYYRGQVYLALYRDTTDLGKAEFDAPEKAAISFMNCIKTDKGNYYTDDCYNQVWISGVALSKRADIAYNKNDLQTATRFYKLLFDIFPLDKNNNMKRSNVTEEGTYMSLFKVASKGNDDEKAKEYLQKLIDLKFNDPLIYIYMSNILLAQKDTAKALTYIDMGRSRFEEDQKIINEEIRIYSAQGKTDLLIDKLGKAIEANPDNEVLYFRRAILYEKRKETDKAVEDYKKALEIKPNYFDANYHLGAMYFNQAANKLNAIASIKNADEYAKAKEKCETMFNQSQPYFEKAHEVNPKDQDTMNVLKQLYFRQNNMDKYNKIKAEMESAGK